MSNFTRAEAPVQEREHNSALPLYIVFPLGVLCLYSLAFPWPSDHLLVRIAWTLLTANVFLCYTSLFHELAHHTLVRSKLVNIWLGRILGTIALTPYTAYRESHIRHHAYLNKPCDWELWPYSDPNASLSFRRAFVWLDILMGFLAAPYVYVRIYFAKDSPLQADSRRAIRWELAAIVVAWGGVLGFVAWKGAWIVLLTVWVLPHWMVGILQTCRKLTEHLGMESIDPLFGTRTVVGMSLFTRVTTFLNFHIFVHGPHHRHPRDSHAMLMTRMQAYQEENPHAEYPVYSSYWRAFRAMAPWLIRNPGVGINLSDSKEELLLDGETTPANEPVDFVSPDELGVRQVSSMPGSAA